jgi:uncharacterized protein YukJ
MVFIPGWLLRWGHPKTHKFLKDQYGKEQYEQSTTKRKMYNPSINIELMREMEILAAQLDVRQNDILEEAIQDLLEKYKDQEPARVISNRI